MSRYTIRSLLKMTTLIGISVWVALLVARGYRVPHRDPVETELKAFGFRYHLYFAENGRSPKGIDELVAFVPRDAKALGGARTWDIASTFDRIRDGRIRIHWNAALFPDSSENNAYVLGYAAKVPVSGGLILRGGGAVEYVTADEFTHISAIPTRRPDK